MKRNYQTVYGMVETALENDLTWNLAVAFTQENDSEKVKGIVAEQYQQASEGVEDFDLTIEQYLFEVLDDCENENMKEFDVFESKKEAENEGFYWEDEIDRWLKLDVNK